MSNKQILFVSRPETSPSLDNFSVQDVPKPEASSLQPGDLLVKIVYASVDPYMRGRMNAGTSYAPGWELNKPAAGHVVVQVEASSEGAAFTCGEFLVGFLRWELYQIVPAASVTKTFTKVPDFLKAHASYFIGACGMPGLSALLPIEHIGNPKPGEVAFVSGAAGAVGSTAGQILKLKGCKVYGSAGTDEKVKWLVEELGFDGAFNYNTTDINAKLKELVPGGVDIFFDNVGGQTLEILLDHMRKFGRVIMCGSISNYNKGGWESSYGVRSLLNVIGKSLKIQGFIVSDWLSEFGSGTTRLVEWVKDGKLKVQETVVDGFENIPKAFIGLFSGQNQGKMVVKA